MRLGKKKPTEQAIPKAPTLPPPITAYNTYNSITAASGGGVFNGLIGGGNFWTGTAAPKDYFVDRPQDGFKNYRMVKVEDGDVVVTMPPAMLDDLIALLDDDEEGAWTDVLDHLVEAAKQIKEDEERKKRQEEEDKKNQHKYDKLQNDYYKLFGTNPNDYFQESLFNEAMTNEYDKIIRDIVASSSLFDRVSPTSPSA